MAEEIVSPDRNGEETRINTEAESRVRIREIEQALAAEPGFEPGLMAPKATVLPLHNSASWCRRSDSNRHGGRPPSVFETDASTHSATSACRGAESNC